MNSTPGRYAAYDAWLAGAPDAYTQAVHDFDPDDPHGRCRRPGCEVPFLDAGAECPAGGAR